MREKGHGRFRDSDLFRYLFDSVLIRCIAERFVGDGAYGNAETLGWLVHEKGIEPHVKWSQKIGQLAKVYPKPLKGCENGEAPELYRSV